MILVFGNNGQVATALRELYQQTKVPAKFIGSDEANFLDTASVVRTLEENHPTIVINAAAYTQVDKAESEKENALTINATTPGEIAKWCKKNDALLVHYSTDYVFDGTGEKPWLETDTPNPVNYYGYSKWQGEKAIQASGCKHYICRISWIYSPWGHNFKKTILRLAAEREELKIVADQWGSPTRAEDVAKRTAEFVFKYEQGYAPPLGIHHWRFDDYTTWHAFAVKFIEEARTNGQTLKVQRILPIRTEDFPTPALRPKNSRMGSVRK